MNQRMVLTKYENDQDIKDELMFCQKLAGEQLIIFRNHTSINNFCLRIANKFKMIEANEVQLTEVREQPAL